jgi:HD-like signal output (HDOD) protein
LDVKAILTKIAETAARDELIFPTTTEMALKLQQLLDDPDCSIDQLTRLVQVDPLLAARVVAVANSVTYNRSGKPVTDITSAISRIGYSTLRVLATSVVVRQMAGMSRIPAHRQIAIQLWEHTAHVSALSQVIARRVTRVNPDTAFFAGMAHEVGGFYLISRAADYPGLLEGKDGSLTAWIDGGAAEIGRAVLQRLSAPAAVIEAIEGMWEGSLGFPPQSLADTLMLADELAPVVFPLAKLAGSGLDNSDAHIDFTLDEDTLCSILEESSAEVESLITALRA